MKNTQTESVLSRSQKKMIKKNNFSKKWKKRIIPMTSLEDGRKVVSVGCLSIINHPKKIMLNISEDYKMIFNQLISNKEDGLHILDFINNSDGENTSIIKENNKLYEWESGKEIIITNHL